MCTSSQVGQAAGASPFLFAEQELLYCLAVFALEVAQSVGQPVWWHACGGMHAHAELCSAAKIKLTIAHQCAHQHAGVGKTSYLFGFSMWQLKQLCAKLEVCPRALQGLLFDRCCELFTWMADISHRLARRFS